ncbi:hypothetical protein GCM10011335_50110 [Aureimonas glaciei]|uniref:Aminoglycoside phosphotransferase n=2 Tax=Aureimonas glaciei TaxID=1776957 RepID=A0A916YDP0_9HYPH|nr:hypothetical protein GCM10011335_50110 [Aureimonas glaciei]
MVAERIRPSYLRLMPGAMRREPARIRAMIDMPDEAVVHFLKRTAFDGIDPSAVETATTHISLLLLGGDLVLKLKRPVRLAYLDFSTPSLRLAACHRELTLNRRTAPQLYTGVLRITRTADGTLRLGEDGESGDEGELVDAVVAMRRFDQATLLDRQAEAGLLDAPLMDRLAATIATFHRSLPADADKAGAARMRRVLDLNEASFAATGLFAADERAALDRRMRSHLARLSPLLDRRAAAGCVRRGHGDLHLRNICRIEGEPVLFDCLEFSEDLGTTDVLHDLAFLLMDLWHRGLEAEANRLMNRYLDHTHDEAGLAAMPFFMALRASVRAHVAATAAADAAASEAAAFRTTARRYYDLALDLLRPRDAVLVAVGGLSGSGKSSVAAALAARIGPRPGARTLSSDRLRKHRFGVSPETRLPEEAYGADVTAAVYGDLGQASVGTLGCGHAVIADATFERPDERERIAAVARAAGVAFVGLWLDVPADTLLRRVGARRGDPSDATPDIVRRQLERGPGAVTWTVVPGEGTPAMVAQRARAAVEAALGRDPVSRLPDPAPS